MHKDIFIDRYKQSNIVEDYKVFLKQIKKLKPYIIEFEKNGVMKPRVYLLDSKISGNY